MRALSAVVAVLLLAGCSSTVAGEPGPFRAPVRVTAAADQVVFQVESGGGMVPVDYALRQRPGLTIYGDGTAYVVVPDTSVADRTVALRRGHVPRAELARLATAAERTGVFDGDVDFGDPQVTDMGATAVTFRPYRAAATTASAYALTWTEGDDRLSPAQRQRRVALRGLLDRLYDSVQDLTSWTPSRVEVVQGYQRADEPAAPWPGPPLNRLLTGERSERPCGVVTGTAAGRVYSAARGDGAGRWTDGTDELSLVVRALLPGELGCVR